MVQLHAWITDIWAELTLPKPNRRAAEPTSPKRNYCAAAITASASQQLPFQPMEWYFHGNPPTLWAALQRWDQITYHITDVSHL